MLQVEAEQGTLASLKEYNWMETHPALAEAGVWVDYWNSGRPGPVRVYFPGEGYEVFNPEKIDILEKKVKEGRVFSSLRRAYSRLLRGTAYKLYSGEV